jgi:hypothetical protein
MRGEGAGSRRRVFHDTDARLRALRASNDDGFGALPIHDALIAPARNIGQAQANMVSGLWPAMTNSVIDCDIGHAATFRNVAGQFAGISNR